MNGYVALGLALGVLSGCNLELKTVPAPVPSSTAISIEPREQLLPTYPCSGCHADRQPRQEKYTLKEFHAVRNSDFSHGEDAFWCYQCHAVKNIDKLTTSTGELVSFNEARAVALWNSWAHPRRLERREAQEVVPRLPRPAPAALPRHSPRSSATSSQGVEGPVTP
jgi:hypothetical protein